MATKKNRLESLPHPVTGHVFRVGDGAHVSFNGDAYPYTVIAISDSGKQIFVSRDKYKVVDSKGGYVEGPRDCVFTTVHRVVEECEVYKLSKKGGFLPSGGRGTAAWQLRPGRAYAQNPSF